MTEQIRASEQQCLDVVEQVLRASKRVGATAAEVAVHAGLGLSATVRMGEVETLEHNRDKSLRVTLYRGQCSGSAGSTDFADQAIRDTVAAANTIAGFTSPDEYAGLVEARLLALELEDLDLFHPWDIAPERAIEIATECEDVAIRHDPRITNSDGATLSHHAGVRAYGNSHGLQVGWSRSHASIGCAVIAEDAEGMQRDYWHSVSRVGDALDSPALVGRLAAERTARRLGARKLDTRRVPVLFEARVARSLFGHFISAVSGGALYRQASFLVGHLDKRIFPGHIRIHEQPRLPRALGSAPIDNDGVATKPRDIVKDGILAGYVLSGYSARKLAMQTTGNAGGVRNLTVDPGDTDLDGLLKRMDTGLMVTELMGFGVNTVTGDYSRGAAGFWVQGGEIQFPVHEVTIAANQRDIFMGMVEIGNDVDIQGNIRTGSVLIDNMTVAGA